MKVPLCLSAEKNMLQTPVLENGRLEFLCAKILKLKGFRIKSESFSFVSCLFELSCNRKWKFRGDSRMLDWQLTCEKHLTAVYKVLHLN